MPTETIVVLVSDEGDTIDRIVRTVCGGTGRKADSAIIISLGRNLNLNPPAKFVTIEELPNAIKETKGDFRIEIESHGLPDSLALLSSGGSISGSELELRLGKAFKDVDIDCMSRCIGVYAPICYSADQSNSTEKKALSIVLTEVLINGKINETL